MIGGPEGPVWLLDEQPSRLPLGAADVEVVESVTVDITNRGRLVAQMIPVRDPESPLERWVAKGVIERAEDDGSILEIDPYPDRDRLRVA